jgi:hypothetical protein
MGATRSIFKYKCEKGHLSEKTFPLGTRHDDYDETTCAECLHHNEVNFAYLIFATATSAKEQKHGHSGS